MPAARRLKITRHLSLTVVVCLAIQACATPPTAPTTPSSLISPAESPASDETPGVPLQLVRPDGAGPFPAVVLMHSCIGVTRSARHIRDWSQRLTAMGYLVAIPDSFSTRGHPDGVCGYGAQIPPEVRVPDAYATLRRLERMPDVLADRVGIIGFSHGGWTTLAALDEGLASRARAAAGAEHGFAAGIAFYPECTFGSWIPAYRTAAPLLILTGELDDWTPAGPCRGLAERVQAQGQPVSFKLYPGAHHAFDTFAPKTRVPEARQGRGATIAGDPAAREDSIREVAAFFARRLKDGPGEPLPRARQ